MTKLSIIMFSGTADKLMPVGVLASAAAGLGYDVEIFATFWGLLALKKDSPPPEVSKDYGPIGEMFKKVMEEKNMPSFLDMLREAKEIGNVKIYACAQTFDMMGLKKEDLVDIVDDVIGAMEYLEKSKESDITLFI
ncbi:MAG TPA: peroxiredoxin [Thermoprotei archaeon]|nr:peroxiredoxin [Thermoprotei archaeon]